MKDIIAAQQICRRSEGSLLSKAKQYRVLLDNSFIADQQLPKRKKNPLLEKIYKSRKQESPLPVKTPLPVRQRPQREKKAASTACGGSVLTWLFRKKFVFLGIFLCLAAGRLALIGYIPDPDPPEDARIRESLTGRNAADSPVTGDIIPLDVTESFAWQNYTVRSGDTVEGISRRFGLSLDAVIASNNLRNVRELRAGERIRIPNMDGIPYTVKSGDSYSRIAASQGVPLEAILDANEIQSEDIRADTVLFIPGAKMDKTALRQALGSLFIWPLTGKQSSNFGWRNDPFTGLRSFHAALDISVPSGTPVKASTDGKVSATGYNSVYGNFLIISHGSDYQTMYAHLSRILVKNGASISQGAIIARSGNSGRSTGPHLHFAVYKNKRAINPLEVLNK